MTKKEVLEYMKLAKKAGAIEFEVGPDVFKIKFAEVEKWGNNKKAALSKVDRERLDFIKKQAEVDEMMIMDPAAYEDNVASGMLVEGSSDV